MREIDDQIRIFLDGIHNDRDTETNLSNLKVALANASSRQLLEFGIGNHLSLLLDCLNTSNKSQILKACEVLKIVLPLLTAHQLFTENGSGILRALGHPMVEVKVVILDELIRVVSCESLIDTLENDSTWLIAVGSCLCHEDVSIGKRAVEFCIKLGQTKRGLVALCKPSVISEFMKNIGDSHIYSLRIFEVLAEISATSADFQRYLENEGLLDRISTFIRTDDILAMLALIEVIKNWAVTSHGWDFLTRHGIIKHLAEQFVSYEESPLSSLSHPGLCKFFGEIGQSQPLKLMSGYPDVVRCAFSCVDVGDLFISIPSLELIGMLGYSNDGKLALSHEDAGMKHALEQLFVAITKFVDEWKIRALHIVSNLIHVEPDYKIGEATKVSEKWFGLLGPSALEVIERMGRQPFFDIKTGALLVIRNMASQEWGQLRISQRSSLVEFLLDRRTENEAMGHQTKYDILKVIVDSDKGALIFSQDVYEQFVEYVKQGPFYAPTVTQVAIEGAD